jgi:hypothetical protein
MKSLSSRTAQGPRFSTLAVVSSFAVCLAVGGCQSTGGVQGGDGSDLCNPVAGAIVGALLGGILGGDKHRGEGAVIGAGLGALACVAVNSRQTKPAAQVEKDYRQRHAGNLPTGRPIVQVYDVEIRPDNRVRAGDKVQVVSSINVVRGTKGPVEEVKEELMLTDPEGRTKTAGKLAIDTPGSGAYVNTFTLTFPKDVAPGTYRIQTRLVVNGNRATVRKQNLVIAAVGEARHFALVSP